MTQETVQAMEHTGERMVPESSDSRTFWEHIYRYRFAAAHVRNRRVLDIACGEGYGTRALAEAGATSVIGVDVSEEACAHARQRYGVDARWGNAENIPLPDRSIDVVVSFETIEHISRPEAFLDECARVLVPGGQLIVSTPNGSISNQTPHNPFHCSDMDEQEFNASLTHRFSEVNMYTQSPESAAWWSLRSWAARQSVWTKMRGVWRLRSLLCPHICRASGAGHRLAPVKAVLEHDWPFSAWINPFVVRRLRRWTAEKPVILIAVARKSE